MKNMARKQRKNLRNFQYWQSKNDKTKKNMIRYSIIKYSPSIPLLCLILNMMQLPSSMSVSTSSSQLPEIQQQESVRRYTYLDSRGIYEALNTLAQEYPHLATLESAQQRYNLPAAGTSNDCAFDHRNTEMKSGCQNWFLTIEDKYVHGTDVAVAQDVASSLNPSYQSLPEVFLSGALHGNERIGPTAVVETAALLLDAADCESFPRMKTPSKTSNSLQWEQWEQELQKARSCRKQLSSRGITPYYRKWLARLVTTRRIVILPTANALGYFRNQREEDGIDPNRDFPYDLKNAKCMLTIAARTINEIFLEHMFQLSLTFHAGMAAIGYEWGAPSFSSVLSPDDIAQGEIGKAYSKYAGRLPETFLEEKHRSYPYGAMNDIVYPVRGGMEDWAYAASWDIQHASHCRPRTYGGYPSSKTKYNDATLRMFNMLVETSRAKIPDPKYLGTNYDLFNPNQDEEAMGHISRNIRLALMMIDIVEPYAYFTAVEDQYLHDDIVPSLDRSGRSCAQFKVLKVPQNGKLNDNMIQVQWTVGGGFAVFETGVLYGKWENMPDTYDGSIQPTDDMLKDYLSTLKRTTSEVGGRTRWHEKGSFPSGSDVDSNSGNPMGMDPIFTASIDISDFEPGDDIAVLAYTMLDPSWGSEPKSGPYGPPDIPPQSHIANARTNRNWHFESAGKVIQGREWWFSIPVTLLIKEKDSTFEIAARLPTSDTTLNSRPTQLNNKTTTVSNGQAGYSFIFITISVIIVVCLILAGSVRFVQKRSLSESSFQVIDSETEDIGVEDDYDVVSLELSEKKSIT